MSYNAILICLCFLVNSVKGFSQSKRHFFVRADSLILKAQECDSINLINQYYKWNNFNIPEYFTIKDSLKLKINGDSLTDIILVLSPRFQEYEISEINCDEKINRRLLLFFVQKNNQYKLVAINSKAIPNVQDYPEDPFLKIKRNNTGIVLYFLTGSSRKCKSEFYFQKHNNSFILKKSIAHFYLINLSKQKDSEKMYKYSEKNDLRIIDLDKYVLDLNNNINL
jgi:hypothetical protein